MTSPINTALMNLMKTVNELNRPDFSVFLRYAGHVKNVEIHYHAGGYENNPNGPTYLPEVYIHDAFNDGMSDNAIATNIEILRQNLILASNSNADELARAKAKLEAAERRKYEELKAKFEKGEA